MPDALVCDLIAHELTHVYQCGIGWNLIEEDSYIVTLWNDVPIANVSFAGSEFMLDLLTQCGDANGKDYTRLLINSQVVLFVSASAHAPIFAARMSSLDRAQANSA